MTQLSTLTTTQKFASLEVGQHGVQSALLLGQLVLQLLHDLDLHLGLGRALLGDSVRAEQKINIIKI